MEAVCGGRIAAGRGHIFGSRLSHIDWEGLQAVKMKPEGGVMSRR